MNELTQLLNRLHPNYKEIANKWQDRQKLEEELGIPTSDSLTELSKNYNNEYGEYLLKVSKLDI